MNINQILEQMSADIAGMSGAEKVIGCIAVTLLCMAVVFVVLMILMFGIQLMQNTLVPKEKVEESAVIWPDKTPVDDSEVVAAIVAAVCGCMRARDSKIVIRSIVPVQDPAWARASLNDQINGKL